MGILKDISGPEDIKGFSIQDLTALAAEIRAFILSSVSQTGGHLASSLGAVELTLALHYVFNAPEDKMVWDVGHQAYPHKVLTGRQERFATLRQYQGLSPFINPAESAYDTFISGHAGNAVSAASGICEAMMHSDNPGRVISVIGDGSLSNGLTFEGLNYVGTRKLNLIVVLNDNNMFISKNVGAIADYLSRIMTSRRVRGVKDGIKGTIERIPAYGDAIYRIVKYVESNLKGVVSAGEFFEVLGFRYVGPIDGHNMDHLIEAFGNISEMDGPIFIHVKTQKGKGYLPAVENPEHFHGVGGFHMENGESTNPSTLPGYSAVFGQTLVRLAKKNDKIVAITAAMTTGTGLDGFAHLFPERFFDVGIAEGHAVTMAAGMALYGLRPVVAIYSTFMQRCYDGIIHDVALQKAPVIFAIDRAGIVGKDGPTHHGVFDLMYLRGIPNLTLMAPRDQLMLEAMLSHALEINGPVAIRYPRGNINENPIECTGIKGAEVLLQGSRACVFCVGNMCYTALDAIGPKDDIAIVDLVFAKPLDEETIRFMVKKCRGRFIVVEEGCIHGGIGTAVLEVLRDMGAELRFRLLGIPDNFVEHGDSNLLKDKIHLNAQGIRDALEEIL